MMRSWSLASTRARRTVSATTRRHLVLAIAPVRVDTRARRPAAWRGRPGAAAGPEGLTGKHVTRKHSPGRGGWRWTADCERRALEKARRRERSLVGAAGPELAKNSSGAEKQSRPATAATKLPTIRQRIVAKTRRSQGSRHAPASRRPRVRSSAVATARPFARRQHPAPAREAVHVQLQLLPVRLDAASRGRRGVGRRAVARPCRPSRRPWRSGSSGCSRRANQWTGSRWPATASRRCTRSSGRS